jgi:hypothetical protein
VAVIATLVVAAGLLAAPTIVRTPKPGWAALPSVLAVATSPAGPAGPAVRSGPGTTVAAGFSPVSVTYVSTSVGWVLGTVRCGTRRCFRLVNTTNDGAGWSPVPLPHIGPVAADSAPVKVRFADNDDGWIFSIQPGQAGVEAWSTHNGGRRWSAINFPVKSPNPIGPEDLEAAGGVVNAAVLVGDEVDIFSSPVGRDAWRRTGGPFQLGAGPVPSGELALQGSSGWFVQNDRVVVSGGRDGSSGAWATWQPPCSKAGGPVLLAAPTNSQVDAVCTEGVWTGGPQITVDLLTSTDGGASFGPSRPVPGPWVGQAAAIGPSTVAVGDFMDGDNSTQVTLEMSFNGGGTWRPVYRHRGTGWLELGFTTVEQGVAIVAGAGNRLNTMLFTTDGGKHWAPVDFG